MNAGTNNWNYRKRNYQHRMDRKEENGERNKTLITEICENIDTLGINKLAISFSVNILS